MKNTLSIRDITFIGMGAAILAVLSQFSIPLPFSAVPLTLQVPAVILISIIFKPKQSFLSVLVFLLLGAIGLPVFASFHGGFNIIVGPTGGYLLGFLIMPLIISNVASSTNTILIFILTYIALAFDYLVGVLQLSLVAHLSVTAALAAGLYPFIVKDIIVVFITILLGLNIKRRLNIGTSSNAIS
ncbi:biotin transporter BioY [Clostridium sp. 'White wine YQ']|uniref:biotin transporter BioY n=1 Tax=Clostridium sp. 'White wine YQ' TaxID=3027474 RepID=UPI00236550F1|nr:biotin transporter BioY [Clostridium sp. 'White wine YQ']MDD7796303.1 biotin transporter BioY [Clostridium sp. 'White wine YQ']